MRNSTRLFFREASRTQGYSFLNWLHGYIYGRWPYLYIGIGKGTHPLNRLFGTPLRLLACLLLPDLSNKKALAEGYHGKVMPLEAAARLITVNENVCLTDLEQIIPYNHARDIILQNPHHIAVLECPCRAYHPNPCLPLDVCLIVGDPFAGFIVEHHPHRSRWITPEEGMEILQSEHKRGHVHHAFFKDAMLNRFYAICNCCNCCCGAMNAYRNGTPMIASSGYVCHVISDLCAGCENCVSFCQFGALSIIDDIVSVDTGICMGCGVCISKCPREALLLLRDPSKGEPLEIHRLIARVNDTN
ncbi:MAG TPA: 4Fe-4S binding protein [Syntrophales bacterium]|nr:4Fe-4S binding protein [Syntrophales bacterium]